MIYEIAGMRISINNRCKYTDRFCQGYLSKDQETPADITAVVTDEEFYAEKELSEGFSDGYIENICLYRCICRQLPQYNRMLLHSAVIQYDGEAFAFLGRSGTGKSTHTGLWMQYLNGVSVVNGDKPILECRQNEFWAYGTPWQGKENLGENTFAPLKGLCFLEQAKVNKIEKLTPAQAASRIFQQVLLPDEAHNAEKTLELIDTLVTHTPCYLLQCDISETAVKKSFEALTGKAYPVKN